MKKKEPSFGDIFFKSANNMMLNAMVIELLCITAEDHVDLKRARLLSNKIIEHIGKDPHMTKTEKAKVSHAIVSVIMTVVLGRVIMAATKDTISPAELAKEQERLKKSKTAKVKK